MSGEQMYGQFRDLRKQFEDPMPDTIYHYTSPEGFRGILASGEIWLTNAAFVNDTTECRLFWESVPQLFKDGRPSNRAVQDVLDMGRRPRNDAYYVASFSRVADSLQQYRAYGGIGIGFDPHRMSGLRFRQYECVYAKEDMEKWVHEKSTLPKWNDLDEVWQNAAAFDLLFAAEMKYKSKQYSSEQEMRMVTVSDYMWNQDNGWNSSFPDRPKDFARIVHANEPPIHFRDHRVYGVPVPYVKFFLATGGMRDDSPNYIPTETVSQMNRRRLKEEDGVEHDLLPITEVSIGPMARKDEAKLACEIMLQEKGYENVRVDVPEIPYRGA